MSEETIRDYNGRILGYIQKSSNGDKTIYDSYHGIIGYYIKSDDVTTDACRRPILRGEYPGFVIAENL